MPIILPATLATAAACAVLSVWMAMRIGQIRRARKIWMGDGGDTAMIARMRAQANFVEYAPFVLILLAMLELAKGPSLAAWGYGLVFVVARVLHVFGMDGWKPGRMAGAIMTLLILLLLAGECAWVAFSTPYVTAPVIVDVPLKG
ncbi:MAPEG family protein [uncultured Sphingomonas sp.]|uniref:MAPEG family protein n=1 Tax=uncultured Sphingomonas sp. TaxID=158754 RepID=UPI0025CF7955|nr:MAPEG family protein [uncultured Sphingomonas sp.]